MDEPYQASDDVYVLPMHLPFPGLGNLVINSYLIKAQEPVLVDTAIKSSPLAPDESDQFIAAIESIVPLRDLRWLWLTHDDMDHTGSIQRIMEAAPQVKLATNALAAMRMSTWWPVPLDRVYAITFGDRLDVGDRKLLAVAPPSFDNPTSTGILDESTGNLFSVDCFGGIIPELTTDAAEVPAEALQQGMIAWMKMDEPWTSLVDADRWDAVLDGVRRLSPNLILSSHLPAASGTSCENFLAITRSLRDIPAPPPPNNEQFQQMLAMMGPPPSASGAPAAPAAPVAAGA